MSDEHVTPPGEEDPPPSDEDRQEPAPVPSGPVCSECGRPIDPEQQYCLECGAPTETAVPLRSRRSTPALIGASLLALGIGAASLIYATTREDSGTSSASVTSATTFPTVPTLPTFPTATNPFPTATVPPTTTAPTYPTFSSTTTVTTTGTTGNSGKDYTIEDDWQYEFETRWTVVMQSATDLLDAQDYCDMLRSRNVSCGILNSDFYSSLNDGYFVVFHGAFATKAAADSERAHLTSSYPTAYVRKVEV